MSPTSTPAQHPLRRLAALSAEADESPGSGFWNDLAELVAASLEELPPHPLPVEVQTSAIALSRVPFEKDPTGKGFKACVDFWLGLGPLGWTMAAARLHEAQPWPDIFLDLLSQSQQLLLAQFCFMAQPEHPSPLTQAVSRRINSRKAWDADEFVEFLALIGRHGIAVRLQLVHAAASCETPLDLRELLQERLDDVIPDIPQACLAAIALNEHLSAKLLLKTLGRFPANAPSGDYSRLVQTLRLVPDNDPQLPTLLVSLLEHIDRLTISDRRLLLLRLCETSANLNADLAGLPEGVREREAPACMLLTGRGPEKTLASPRSLRQLLCVTRRAWPDLCADLALRLVEPNTADPDLAQSLKTLTQDLQSARSRPAPWEEGLCEDPREPHPEPGLLEKLHALRRGGGALAAALEKGARVQGLNLSGAKIGPLNVARKNLLLVNLNRCQMDRVTFDGATLRQVSFDKAQLKELRFRGCRFEEVTFKGTQADAVVFDHCSFKDVRFKNVHFTKAVFREGQWTRVQVRDSLFEGCSFDRMELCLSGLFRAVLDTCEFRSSHFQAVDLRLANLRSCELRGVSMDICRLSDACLDRCHATSSRLRGCVPRGVAFLESSLDDPSLLTEELNYRRQRLLDTASEAPPEFPAWANDEGSLELGRRILSRLQEYFQLRGQEALFLLENQRRDEQCRQGLRGLKHEFHLLAPLLLETNLLAFLRPSARGPRCLIHGHEPSFHALRLAEKRFGAQALQDELETRKSPASFQVEAVYTIGSLGTVAQSRGSDIDWWICLASDGDSQLLSRLQSKLEAMTRYAQEDFGLETTFFPMDMEDIRSNRFGFSDRESSGTAQALLLKEEFYRTVLKVAGRYPAWWLSPSRVTPDSYRRVLESLLWAPLGLKSRVADLGPMEAIPASEFFGASLWQLVKAFKSPFKSVLKFGLLEQYVNRDRSEFSLLCERLKRNLLSGAGRLLVRDPYALLYHVVRLAYSRAGARGIVRLVDLAFLIKVEAHRLPEESLDDASIHKRRLLLEVFGPEDDDPAQPKLPAPLSRGRGLSFGQTVELGQRINDFMLRTYAKVQESLSNDSEEARISPEDLTKLGRLLFSTFSRRPDKVPRIPFINATPLTQLSFMAHKAMQRPTVWSASGLPPDMAARRENFIALRKEQDPVRLALFLTANRLYSPGAALEADPSLSPISANDLQRLLKSLYEYFPAKEIFDVDPAETLQPERATRAMLVLNLLEEREQREVREAGIIFCTNWGELFYQTPRLDLKLLLEKPLHFVAKSLEVQVRKDTRLALFLPRQARCPRPARLAPLD